MNANEWQPIETAPKDGECFIGVLAGEPAIYSVIVWYAERFESADDGQPRTFTHWMPLPDPPKDGE